MSGGLHHGADSTATPYRLASQISYRVLRSRTAISQAMDNAILSQSEHQAAVGARLRRVIDLLGMSYKQAADLMGVQKQTVNGWMAGEGYPNWYGLYRLNRAKGVTYDFLFLGDWSGLPAKLAIQMDEELKQEMDAALVRDRVGAES